MILHDRRVYAISASGDAIVRYDRAGKWYMEGGGDRVALTLGDAVKFASQAGASVYHGVPGGRAFYAALAREQR